MNEFVKERDLAFTEFVKTDDLSSVLAYCLKYKIKTPDNLNIFKAGIYKAVQECSGISESIKALAREKCVALGFNPTMWG